jgi:molybdate transport system substrate-binding protein
MISRRAAIQLAIAASMASRSALADPIPVVAAATDLTEALPLVAGAFQKRTGKAVRLVFGPTHVLTQQIRRGGGDYEVFLAADEAYVHELDRAGLTLNSGALYGIGRLALYVPRSSKVRLDPRLRDLGAAAADGRLQRLAVLSSNGPYGRATRDALTRARLWLPLQPKLALAETAAQLAQMVTSGSAQAGLVPLAVALAPRVHAAGAHVLIADTAHRPLRQRAVVLKGASQTAEAFYRFLRDPEARAILRRHGFTLPGGR